MLMTERGIVVTEMLQLWNAAPETFVKQLGVHRLPGGRRPIVLTGTEALCHHRRWHAKGNAEDCTEGY
jgi:hypothetical protein